MTTNPSRTAGPKAVARTGAPIARARRQHTLRVVRDERRRLEQPRRGRFDYLKRTYE